MQTVELEVDDVDLDQVIATQVEQDGTDDLGQLDELLEAALQYLHDGFCPIPLDRDGKPLISWQQYEHQLPRQEVVTQWWEDHPDANVGIVTGEVLSNIIVLEVVDANHPFTKIPELIGAPCAITGSGGRQYYFRLPLGVSLSSSSGKLAEGVDVHADGGYVVAPPSIDASGNMHYWEAGSELQRKSLPVLPTSLVEKLGQGKGQDDCANEGDHATAKDMTDEAYDKQKAFLEEELNKTLDAFLSNDHVTEDELEEWIELQASQTSLSPQAIRREAQSALLWTVRWGPTCDADAVCAAFLRYWDYRFLYSDNGWMHYTKGAWGLISEQRVKQLFNTFVGKVRHEFKFLNPPPKLKMTDEVPLDYSAHVLWYSLSSPRKFQEFFGHLKVIAWKPIQERVEQNVLYFKNGKLDLSKVNPVLEPSGPADFNMARIPTDYVPGADYSSFEQFMLSRIEPDTLECIQRAVGYSFLGNPRERKYFILYGPTSTGKSTFLSILQEVMGASYMKEQSVKLLAETGLSSNSEEVADLFGSRMNYISEVESIDKYAAGQLKRLSGGGVEKISASRKYEHRFQWTPTHVIWLTGNQLPAFNGADKAMWRRMCIFGFKRIIEEGQEVKDTFKTIVEKEREGILNWIVEGAKKYLKDGLKESEAMRKDMRFYQDELEDKRHLGKRLPEVLLCDPSWFFWALEKDLLAGPLAAEAAWLLERAMAIRIPQDTDGTIREALYDLDFNRFWDVQLIPAGESSAPDIIRRKVLDLSIPYRYAPKDVKGGLRLLDQLRVLLFKRDGTLMQGSDACSFFEDDSNFVLDGTAGEDVQYD